MGRPRKPTVVLEIGGAYKKNKKRRAARAHEPQPTVGLGRPPHGFDESEKARWKELIRLCAPGVLTQQDRIMAESICILWAKLRRREISEKEWGLLDRQLSKFGMSPSDRSKVMVPDANDGDPLAKFVKRQA